MLENLKSYHVEFVDCQTKEVMIVRRSMSRKDMLILRTPVEVIRGESGELIKYDVERVLDRLRVFVAVFSRGYLPISHKIELSSPWPFSRVYMLSQAFTTSKIGFGYSICAVNLDSVHLPFRLSLLLQKVDNKSLRDYVSKLKEMGVLVETPDSLAQKVVDCADRDLADPSIDKPAEPIRIDDPGEIKDYLSFMTTDVLLRRIKKALDDDVEITRGGRHQYKVTLKKTGKPAPVPDHGELPPYFPKSLCKELGIDEVYNITCDEFIRILRSRKRLVRRR